MWPWSTTALLQTQLAKAEQRAELAESALATERDARMRDVRHVLSMWLRHEKALPLPITPADKPERAEQRPQFTDVQLAQREALRREAQRLGISQQEADEKFEQMSNLEQ